MLLLENFKISLVQVTHALHHPDSSHEAIILNVLLIYNIYIYILTQNVQSLDSKCIQYNYTQNQ